MRKPTFFRRPLFWVVLPLALYSLIGFFIVPIIAKDKTIEFVQQNFGRKLDIGSLSVNPFTFTSTIGNLVLYETSPDSFLVFDELFIDISVLPLLNRKIDLPEIRATNLTLSMKMNADSTFNVDDFITYVLNMPPAPPWDVSVDSLVVTGLHLVFSDQTTTPEARFGIVGGELRLGDFRKDSPDTSRFLLKCGFSKGGTADAVGFFVPSDRYIQTSFGTHELSMVPVQPYLSRYAFLTMNSGNVSIGGDLKASAGNPDSMAVSFVGDVLVTDLDMHDNLKDQRFLGWKKLSVENIEASMSPIRIRTDEVRINDVYLRLEIAADQSLNAKDVLKMTKDSTATDTLPMPDIYIGRVVLESGQADFADFSLPLPFATNIHTLTGEITEIVPNNPTGAAVTARGAIDEYGLAKVDGGLDPFAPLAYTDLNVVLTNIELTRLTPYSGKFAGYEIEKGKMSLDLEYVIRNGQLVGKNEMLLEKLTLGDEIESPDATSLPVKLAIALLKDGDGNIDLDLEVEGDLNDPEVNMVSLLWQALTKVIINVATAPFRFLGALLGISGEDMEYIQFEPGKTALTPPQHERLANLSKALTERPALKLEIHGTYDLVTDARALREEKFQVILQEKMTSIGMSPSTEDSVTQASKLLRRALEELYIDEFSPNELAKLQAQNAIQATDTTAAALDVRAYIKAMRSALSELQPVEEAELPALADSRAQAIREHLMTVHQFPEPRIAIVEREDLEDEDDEWVRCRLELDAMEGVMEGVPPAPVATEPVKTE